jgi:hypothetical protein
MIEPSFRTVTNCLILENVKNLIYKEDILNTIDKNHLDIINKTCYSFLSNIKLLIINNKYFHDTAFEHFEHEWNNYKNGIDTITDQLISKPFILIPFNLDDSIEEYPKFLKYQKTEIDMFRSNLIIFMTLYDLRSMIYKNNNLIKYSFPLQLGDFAFEIDHSYNLKSN